MPPLACFNVRFFLVYQVSQQQDRKTVVLGCLVSCSITRLGFNLSQEQQQPLKVSSQSHALTLEWIMNTIKQYQSKSQKHFLSALSQEILIKNKEYRAVFSHLAGS
jgi:hypothetical protein